MIVCEEREVIYECLLWSVRESECREAGNWFIPAGGYFEVRKLFYESN